MERKPVVSSMIRSIGYSPDSETLEVEFGSGGVYQYSGVSARTYRELMDAPSIGTYFGRNIKGKNAFKKV